MKRLFAIAMFLIAAAAHAHPAVSVVVDSHGYAYYSDLSRVWRVTPSGQKSVVVPGVHTHELWLDARDNLYGEHLWYEGDATKKWGHYVWMRRPDGRIQTVVPRTEGFRTTFSFVRDAAGNSYRADRDHNAIIRRSPDGRDAVLARSAFRDIRWMTVTPDGTVYVVDGTDLIRIDRSGGVAAVARRIDSGLHPLRPLPERHLLMGLWVDAASNIYLADAGEGIVRRFDRAGKMTTAARSPWPWFPTGGAFAANGDLWLLEATMTNQVRIRRIARR